MRKLLAPQYLIALSTAVLLFVAPVSLLGQGRGGPPAQPRPAPAPHPGPGGPHGGTHVTVGVGFGYPYWGGFGFGYGYWPWYGYGYPWGFGWGWYPPYGYPFYPYYPYGYGYIDMLTASVRLDVKPRDAEVYVDGYLAGKIDDFDGTFQRLHVRPGEHDLVLYRDGYRTVKQHVYLGPNSDQKIQFAMEPLAPGEVPEPPPTPAPSSDQPNPLSQEPQPVPPGYGRGAPPQPYPTEPGQPQGPPPGYGRGAPPPPPETPPQEQPTGSFGSLALTVQPPDAEILVDGNAWTIPAGETRLVIRLPEGKHHVEIRKAGFATYVEDVGIQRGRTLSLNVSLHSQGGGR
ncbi:MAG TPA: PEGA domain-containing protein [Vicinamibacterales bacterium]|nr:PEGA domain-containing protein [Vicinamibacterales bacterium]